MICTLLTGLSSKEGTHHITMSLFFSLVPTSNVYAIDNKNENISLEEILSKEATKEEVHEVGQNIADQKNGLSS